MRPSLPPDFNPTPARRMAAGSSRWSLMAGVVSQSYPNPNAVGVAATPSPPLYSCGRSRPVAGFFLGPSMPRTRSETREGRKRRRRSFRPVPVMETGARTACNLPVFNEGNVVSGQGERVTSAKHGSSARPRV